MASTSDITKFGVQLQLSWTAYTSEHFDRIYNEHAERIGHRPTFTVVHGGDVARVRTTSADPNTVREIIADLERATADV